MSLSSSEGQFDHCVVRVSNRAMADKNSRLPDAFSGIRPALLALAAPRAAAALLSISRHGKVPQSYLTVVRGLLLIAM